MGILPDLAQGGTLPGSAWRVPLVLSEEALPGKRPRATLYLPGEMPEEHDPWLAAFRAMMDDYPSAAGYGIPIEDAAVQIRQTGNEWEVVLRWPAREACGEMSEEEVTAFLDKVAPEYRYRGDRSSAPRSTGSRACHHPR